MRNDGEVAFAGCSRWRFGSEDASGAGFDERAGRSGTTHRARRLRRGLAVLALLGACGDTGLPSSAAPERVMVFAAASLRDVMREQARRFERRGSLELSFNFAGSNVLALQLEASPRAADVFLSADRLWTDYLEDAGLIDSGSRVRFLSNRLVVVAAHTSPLAISEVGELVSPEVRYLAVGHPDAVPAGRYARAFLESVLLEGGTLWQLVEERIAPAADVRAALALVEARDDTIGIVYRTDARSSERTRVLLEIPEASTPPIGYFAAVTRETAHRELANEFVRFLVSDEAKAIFERHGFRAPAVPSG